MTQPSRSGLMVSMVAVGALPVGALMSGSALAEDRAPAASAAVSTVFESRQREPLDLRAPNITQLYTSEQLNRILAATFPGNIEGVEVESGRDRMPNTPTPWPGIAAPFWALLNPTQSWRIFMPLPPDQTRGLQYIRANATDAYVLEPAGVPR